MTKGETVNGGWVVESRVEVPKKDGSTFTHVGYWYGPDHGWGATSGAKNDYSTARFKTKTEAEAALRSVFGSRFRRRGYVPVREEQTND